MTEIPGWFACLAVVIVVILGYFLFKFLFSHTRSRWQKDRRRAHWEPDMTSQDKHKDTKVPPVTIDYGEFRQVFILPSPNEKHTTLQVNYVNMTRPVSYMEYEI